MKNTISTEELERIFDEGKEDVLQYFDLSTAQRPNQFKRVNVDFPLWMVKSLDKQAQHLGVPRQALIKMWIAEKLPESKLE
ncbi:type II toxin-antitoxin system BrnA family antitoxin [Actinobacillus minor]|uniref:type II toxin-antitoxin system BrnA family antitoxin n=1 Tax=Actinobacillus minor TaxID=51047 RepID=UPI0026EFFD7C|nr:CopG family antitoxin [Actinobacillus minor]